MKGGKRYWFKLYNNFFDNEKIKQIKRKKDGDRLIVIFINCLAIAANCESGGRRADVRPQVRRKVPAPDRPR